MEEVKDKLQDMKENVQDKLQNVKETVEEKTAKAMDDVQEVAEGVAEEAKEIKAELNGGKPGTEPVVGAQVPAFQHPTGRGLLKWILFGIITLGIYQLVIMTKISGEINTVASRHDGKSTMNYLLLAFIVGPITLGIGTLVWWHRICNRFGAELKRRGIIYNISAGTFWGWGVLGVLLFGLGPLIFIYKFLKASNLINADYNQKG